MTVQSHEPKPDEPWQLAMFRKGLKKRLPLKALKKQLEPIAREEHSLLRTCGDNTTR